ncbi:MBL fold metallo-hydrolase [Epilithonimonas mollis]|uniref:Glyoxylase, beta-lactamase superfamily II n=1 Tax=Epilithonimonas mollis TaxID=216903 RepID=A0A1M6RA32_9FLAO|nr:MBL fold metallo-hydrolase [Epilithonimonas mollis]SHK29335.1 Glyoxylase, beta-lactamase superfamily II [Epilithonimonas mollis]
MLHVKSFAFNPFSENTYIIYNDEKEAFLIDPGNMPENETESLHNFIKLNELKIKNILLTHAHIDHIIGLQWAHDTFNVPVLMHSDEMEILDRASFTAKNYGFFFPSFSGEIQHIRESEILKLGSEPIAIYDVPGHSPGSVAFYNQNNGFVISGDALFMMSIGRTDLYKGDYNQLISSIKNKLLTLPENTKVFSGHGEPTTVGFEKEHNPFLK